METIKALLELLPFVLRVEFSVYCARDVIINLNAETKAPAIAAIELTEKWLKSPRLVTAAELEAAANSANSAAYSAAYSAYSAAYSAVNSAAYSAYSAAYSAVNSAAYSAVNSAAYSAVNSAAYSANSAAYSAYSAAYSAVNSAAYSAAYSANSAEKDNKLLQYETYLKEMIKNLTKLEKQIYNLDKQEAL